MIADKWRVSGEMGKREVCLRNVALGGVLQGRFLAFLDGFEDYGVP